MLLLYFRSAWAPANIAAEITARLGTEFDFRTCALSDRATPLPEACDVLYAFDWRLVAQAKGVQRARTVVRVDNWLTWRGAVSHLFAGAVAGATVMTVSEALATALRARCVGEVVMIPDAVNLDLFTPRAPPKVFTVGWVGNARSFGHDGKGAGLIAEACELARAPLVSLDGRGAPFVPHSAMPAFYAGISVLACASKSESTPLPVLEALACGRPVVSTRVGIVPVVIVEGATGLLVERSVGAFAGAFARLADGDSWRGLLGDHLRHAVASRSWAAVAPAWRALLQ